MTNLCGHDRDVLIWALTSTGRWPEFVAGLLEPSPGLPVYTQRVLREFLAPKREPTLRAIHDPAKLAEMLAERGRELGLPCDTDFPATSCIEEDPTLVWRARDVGVVLVRDDSIREFAMPQARAILLQWLQLPDCAREEAEKALRGET